MPRKDRNEDLIEGIIGVLVLFGLLYVGLLFTGN